MVPLASSRISQRLMPLCAFLTAFTIVMTILVFSTDVKGRRYHRVPLNLSIITDFENAVQDDPQLINYIRENHLKPPPPPSLSSSVPDNNESFLERPEFAEIFESKRGGIFIETGAYRHGDESRTYWLERVLGWRGLLTQPDPHDYNALVKHASDRTNSHTANVCVSPTFNPKEVSFRQLTKLENGSNVPPTVLTKVQCFPLYSLILAYNATNIDFLSLNAEKAEFQVLKTLPFHKVNVRVIGIITSSEDDKENESELLRFMLLLYPQHYKYNKQFSTNKQFLFVCSRGSYGCSAPRISI